MLPAKSVGFVTVFSPGLATALSHVNTSIYCLVLEMERHILSFKEWAILKRLALEEQWLVSTGCTLKTT